MTSMEVAPFKLALVGATQSRVLFKKKENATHCEKWFLFFCQFTLLHTVRSWRKQHVHWSWLGKKSVFSNKPNIYTPHLHVFPLCPVETVLMMAYLTNPMCGLFVGSSHSSGDFLFESDHNSEVWSCAARGIFS